MTFHSLNFFSNSDDTLPFLYFGRPRFYVIRSFFSLAFDDRKKEAFIYLLLFIIGGCFDSGLIDIWEFKAKDLPMRFDVFSKASNLFCKFVVILF